MKNLETQVLCDLWRAYERGDLDPAEVLGIDAGLPSSIARLSARFWQRARSSPYRSARRCLIAQLESGLKFFWNPENLREPVSEAINHGAYERFAGRVIDQCAKRASLAVDAGANIGWLFD